MRFTFAALAGILGMAVLTTSACAAQPEVRGTWVTTTANDAIATPADTAATMRTLHDMGLNTVYVEVWKNGYTQFPSPTLQKTLGVERRPTLMPDQTGLDQPRDLLEETLIQAHRNGMVYIGWFEYGFMAAFKDSNNHLRRMKPEWLTQTRDGQLVSDQNPFVWMNPMHPETQAFLLGIVLDAVDQHDLDGVQLDDRIAWPVTMGYDDYTKQVYASEHGGKLPPDDPRDPAWVQWRADKVSQFAQRFYAELKKRRPNLLVSISPAVYPWSLENYACDWPTWSQRGWMDEYVPQVYRDNYLRFAADWREQIRAVGDRKQDLVAGLRIVGEGAPTPWADVVKMLDLVRETGGGGSCHWFSRGVLEVYPQQTAAYYQGEPAPHPKFPANWRPTPLVAERFAADESPHAWVVDVVEPGPYRVIAEFDQSVWRVIDVQTFEAGRATITAPAGAKSVELLVDRREAPPLPALTRGGEAGE